jgi:hypothetical protein
MQLNTFSLRATEAKTKNKPRVYVFDVYDGVRRGYQYSGFPYRPGCRPIVETSGKLAYRVRVTRKDIAE